MEGQVVDGRIILDWIFRKYVGGCEKATSPSIKRQMMGFCECGNE